jgi:hypothetical protein
VINISVKSLCTVFLGLTEHQIDNTEISNMFTKVGKQELDANMQIVLYVSNQASYIEVIIDKDENSTVTSQKTYWKDVEVIYKKIEEESLPTLCSYSDGFFIEGPNHSTILIELISLPDRPTCIMASIT